MGIQTEIITPEVQKTTEKPPSFIPKEAQEEPEKAITLHDKSQAIVISIPEDYRVAGEILGEIKGKLKYIEDTEESIIKPLRDGYNNSRKKILDFFSPAKEKLTKARDSLGKRMIDWAEDQKIKEREEERRLQELARNRAEEDALLKALEAEAAGEVQEAEQIIQEPIYVPPVKVVSEIPKSKESHIRETWSAEVIDLKILVKAICDGKAPLQAVMPDMTFINGQARSYKQALLIPGVRAVSKKTQI